MDIFIYIMYIALACAGVLLPCTYSAMVCWRREALGYRAELQECRRQLSDMRNECGLVRDTRQAAIRHMEAAVKVLQEMPGFDRD